MVCPSQIAVNNHAAVARVQDRLDQWRPEEHHQLAQEAGEGDLIAVAVQVEVAAAKKDWDFEAQPFSSVTDRESVLLRISQFSAKGLRDR